MSYVLHVYRMTYKTYDMQEYIFVHPEEWYSMSPILRDLFVSSFGHSEKRVVPWRLCASSHLGEPPQCFQWYQVLFFPKHYVLKDIARYVLSYSKPLELLSKDLACRVGSISEVGLPMFQSDDS